MNDQLTTKIDALLEQITEKDEAIRAIYDIFDKFGWIGTFYTREDVLGAIEYFEYDDLTEEQVENLADRIQSSFEWVNLNDAMNERAWEVLLFAVQEYKPEV